MGVEGVFVGVSLLPPSPPPSKNGPYGVAMGSGGRDSMDAIVRVLIAGASGTSPNFILASSMSAKGGRCIEPIGVNCPSSGVATGSKARSSSEGMDIREMSVNVAGDGVSCPAAAAGADAGVGGAAAG